MIIKEVNLSKSSMHYILHKELQMGKLCVKLVPKVLSVKQKLKRVLCTRDWLSQEEGLLNRVMNCGFMSTIPSQSNQVKNGRSRERRGQKGQGRANQK